MGQTPDICRLFVNMLLTGSHIIDPSKFITDAFEILTQDLLLKHSTLYGISLSENQSVSHLDDSTQLRAYLLKVFSDLNRDRDFRELHFNEEDTMLASEFVAPELLPGQFDDGISPDFCFGN